MKKLTVLAILCLSVLLGACNLQPTTPTAAEPIEAQANFWQQMGTVQNAASPSLTLDSSGKPVVSWQEYDGTSLNINVKRWNGNNWVQLGTTLDVNTNQDAYDSSLALDSSGSPVVSWDEYDGTSYNIYVKRWNGITSSWDQLGTTLDFISNQHAHSPSLAVNSSGNPIVSWYEYKSGLINSSIYVKRWNGSSWVQLGTALDVNNAYKRAHSPSLALNSSGNPVVSWTEWDGFSNKIYVKRWNSSTSSWVQLGTFLDANTNQGASSPSLALNSSGNPVVSWYEQDGTSLNIYVKRWDGSSWIQLGTTLDVNTNQNAFSPSLALDSSGNPVVSWDERAGTIKHIYVKRWDGSSWIQLGTFLDIGGLNVNNSSLALDSSGNPVVSWYETGGLYVKRYITNGWQPLGEALDSNPSNDARFSSIARKSDNRPIVAWTEQITSSDYNVYVKERVGSSWKSLGAVDKVAGNFTTSASLAVRSDNRPVVAFTESSANNSIIDVFVRRWNGTSWLDVGGALSNTHLDIKPTLVLNNTNTPFVSWISCTPNVSCELYVKKFNGSSWVAMDGTNTSASISNTVNFSTNPLMVLDSSGKPVVTWEEAAPNGYTLRLKRWTGSNWQSLRSIYLAFSPSFSLAIDSTNKPFVATTRNNLLSVFYLDGTWKRLGTTVDSNNPEMPVLQIGTDNRPVVLWKYSFTFSGFIYNGLGANRWDGSTWVTFGSYAVTDFLEIPMRPDMVLKTNNNPIISFDRQVQSTTKQDVFVKQY